MQSDEFISVSTDLNPSDNEAEDDVTHNNLLKGIASMSSKKRVGVPRSEPAQRVSEFGFAPSTDKISLYELCGSLDKSAKSGELKKQLNRVGKSLKVVEVPLSKSEQEKIHRVVGYEVTTKEVSKWDPIVEENRKTKQLKFPLYQSDIRMLETTAQSVSSHKPRTELELQVAALLNENRSVLPDGHPLSAAEQLALRAVSLEEAAHRRAELQKQRALLSYYGAKMKREGKIKSKKYHRIRRKSQKKKDEQAMEALKQSDPEAYQQTIRRTEMQRIKERMSLKHKGTSNFLKRQSIYAKYDPSVRQAVQDMLQKGQELREKTTNFDTDSDDGNQSDSSSADEAVTQTNAKNPWMSSKPVKSGLPKEPTSLQSESPITDTRSKSSDPEVVRSDEDDDDDFDVDELFESSAQSKSVVEDEELDSDLEQQSKVKESLTAVKKRKKQLQKSKSKAKRRKIGPSDASNDEDNAEDSNDEIHHDLNNDGSDENDDLGISTDNHNNALRDKKVKKNKKKGKKKLSADSRTNAESSTSNVPGGKVRQEVVMSHATNLVTSESGVDAIDEVEDESDALDQHRMTLAEAFADDNVVEEFAAEKKAVEDRDKPKDIDLTLPGWGDWTGPGIKTSQRKKKRFIIKAPPGPPRRDEKLTDVIISELKDESVAKLQVNSLPFPYKNIHDFQKSIVHPIGAAVNPVAVFRNAVKPKIVTRLGAVIQPISKSETFEKQQQKKKQSVDKSKGQGSKGQGLKSQGSKSQGSKSQGSKSQGSKGQGWTRNNK